MREAAKKIGLVPQNIYLAGMLTVYDFVMTGRRPYIDIAPSKVDEEKVYEALKTIGAIGLVERTL
ncbi:MAG: hypothetical protein ACP5JW_07735 [Candidatus Bathyarchaeia archaeon]